MSDFCIDPDAYTEPFEELPQSCQFCEIDVDRWTRDEDHHIDCPFHPSYREDLAALDELDAALPAQQRTA